MKLLIENNTFEKWFFRQDEYMKNLVVVGSGGYSKVIIDTVIEQKNYNILVSLKKASSVFSSVIAGV